MASTLDQIYLHLLHELRQRGNLLVPQAKHIQVLANYVAHAQVGSNSTLPAAVSERAQVVEEELATSLRHIGTSIAALAGSRGAAQASADGAEAIWRRVMSTRVRGVREIANALNTLRHIQRALIQETDGIPIDYTHPATLHGLEQTKVLEATSELAVTYHHLAIDLANRSVFADQPLVSHPSDVLITHDHLPFPRQRSVVSNEGTRVKVFARLPVWYGYLPRFLPVLAHEMSHPLLDVARGTSAESATAHRRTLTKYAAALEQLWSDLGAGHLNASFENLAQVLLEECLADILALRLAGPSYLPALAISALGVQETSLPTLEIPLSVRLRMVLVCLDRLVSRRAVAWRDLADAVSRHLDVYEQLLGEVAPQKRAYFNALEPIVRAFVDEMYEVWGLGTVRYDVDGQTAGRLVALATYAKSQASSSEFAGVTVPADFASFEASCGPTAPAAAIPNLIWRLYLSNPDYAYSGRELPEGRLFHEWRRLAESGELGERSTVENVAFGSYWEFLFQSMHWTTAIDGLPQPTHIDEEPGIARWHVLGRYDALLARKEFQAKSAAPMAMQEGGAPYFTERHLAQEIRSYEIRGQRFDLPGPRAANDVCACMSLKYPRNIPVEHVVGSLHAWRQQHMVGPELVGAFRSLAWEDYILFWKLSSMRDIEALVNVFMDSSCPAPSRVITQLLLPVGATQTDAGDAVGAGDSVLRLSIHGRLPGPAALAGLLYEVGAYVSRSGELGGIAVHPCLGREDVIFKVATTRLADLGLVLRLLVYLKTRGVLSSTSTRVLTTAEQVQ